MDLEGTDRILGADQKLLIEYREKMFVEYTEEILVEYSNYRFSAALESLVLGWDIQVLEQEPELKLEEVYMVPTVMNSPVVSVLLLFGPLSDISSCGCSGPRGEGPPICDIEP